MPAKNPITYEIRRQFISTKIDELLKDKTNTIYTVSQAKLFISERILFCELRSIDRMLLPYKEAPKQQNLFVEPTRQLTLFNNL